MNNKELREELRDIKKLLVLQLLSSDVRAIEIAEILGQAKSNFSAEYKTRKLIKRMKQNSRKNVRNIKKKSEKTKVNKSRRNSDAES